jgi:hypothetical protein
MIHGDRHLAASRTPMISIVLLPLGRWRVQNTYYGYEALIASSVEKSWSLKMKSGGGISPCSSRKSIPHAVTRRSHAKMVDHPMNWVLLAELVTVVVGASAFLFYWNRLVASIFAFILRLITWRLYSAYISIGALQVSPLAGRISFRDLEYHSSNISVRALNGHITWRYWKLRVRHEEDTESTNLKRSAYSC